MADLVSYGIHEEQVDLRAHVCVLVRRVYVYAANTARDVLAQQGGMRPAFRTASAYQNGARTAEGMLVPPEAIPGCRAFELFSAIWTLYPIRRNMPPDAKGRAAANIVRDGLRAGMIALPMQPRLIQDVQLQIDGVDVIASVRARIQIKCDYEGGAKWLGGTGNLFIQTAERNPEGLH